MGEIILHIKADVTKEEVEELKDLIETRTDIVSIIDDETSDLLENA